MDISFILCRKAFYESTSFLTLSRKGLDLYPIHQLLKRQTLDTDIYCTSLGLRLCVLDNLVNFHDDSYDRMS